MLPVVPGFRGMRRVSGIPEFRRVKSLAEFTSAFNNGEWQAEIESGVSRCRRFSRGKFFSPTARSRGGLAKQGDEAEEQLVDERTAPLKYRNIRPYLIEVSIFPKSRSIKVSRSVDREERRWQGSREVCRSSV